MANYQTVVLAGQPGTLVRPSKGSGRLVLFCHGAPIHLGSDLYVGWDYCGDHATVPGNFLAIASLLAENGYASLATLHSDASLAVGTKGHTYGNNVSTAQLKAMADAAKLLPGVSANGGTGLIAVSMGNATILNYWRRYGSTVKAMYAVVPIGNLDVFRGTDAAQSARGGYATINAAFSTYGTVNDALWNGTVKPIHETTVIAPTITVPYCLETNSDDTSAVPSEVDALAALVPAQYRTRVNRGVGGHSMANAVPADILNFLSAAAW
jgi:hypothetical protein